KRAYSQPYDTAFTDDASVVERIGIDIETLPGEKFNLKITTPEDMDLARILLAQ
ncbi:MAG: 2-C-methyl-D-erythritol 4-phosphate cytidylyltransferase, partial [Bacteroidales bacterium]|nr:2-C-methyl-D-erythritol 4-phosphate cytidylyltransferase [Bacteroidales bacterium]